MRLDTLWLLLAIAAMYGLVAHVVDVVGAYLNGELKERIYMKKIPGYEMARIQYYYYKEHSMDYDNPDACGMKN